VSIDSQRDIGLSSGIQPPTLALVAVVCAQCGQENPDGFRFCGKCGAALAEATPAREVRKTVTVLFADVVGSTALGESRDPEAVRAQMANWFEDARTILTRHGGTVEKFIGDAVMAVFGVPRTHEDDALRAVRAAAELQRPMLRIGVNTGEVVAGEGETIVTGDAVNVATRLEQAAGPGEVLIGMETFRLVRDAVGVEKVPPLDLKGKAEPVTAYRLLQIDAAAEGVARRLDSPLVGRRRESERLRADFEHVVSERTCQLFTLLGPAGVGKSRLVLDFLESADARAVRARCLPYGEGITYWPLVEVVLQLEADPETILGSSPPETQLAFRRLLERAAAEKPLVVVLDDLQWAEETFLDLVEHVADWSRNGPIFLLCVARPELLDSRPMWGGGKPNASSVLLEPLPANDIDQLLDNLLDGTSLDSAIRERILKSADGNPLFVEEMIAMVREEGGGAMTVPPTIQALLQARLDRLGDDERAVIERGSVEGEVFHQTAVIQLAPEQARPGVPQRLLALVRKELIRPSMGTLPGDEAFRFRHLLIRDAAYDSLPKSTRADLHERFAVWLQEHVSLVEQDEIVGYHLEQAVQYRKELGTDQGDLAAAAAASLQRASRAAEGRGDVLAADNLSRRAANLLPSGHPQRLVILPFLVELAIGTSRFAAAEEAIAELAAADEPGPNAYATILRVELQTTQGATHDLAEVRSRIADAAETLAEVGDERGLALAERMLGGTYWMECRAEAASDAYERARAHAERAGDTAFANAMRTQIGAAAIFGPKPVDEALAAAEQRLAAAAGKPLVEASVKRGVGRLSALQGDFARARRLLAEGSETLREAGLVVPHMAGAQARGFIERLAGDGKQAAEYLREGAEEFRRVGDRRYLSTTALSLVLVLLDLGEIDEAKKWLEIAAAERNPADVVDEADIHAAQGRLAAIDGDYATAIQEAEKAVELAETTDFYDVRTNIQIQHGRVLALAGRPDEARAAFERAREITRAKGATVWTKQIDALLAEL
jgi:class 3 adenylate cyclase/tetratricopeptide (TPR) repeat protein